MNNYWIQERKTLQPHLDTSPISTFSMNAFTKAQWCNCNTIIDPGSRLNITTDVLDVENIYLIDVMISLHQGKSRVCVCVSVFELLAS